MNNEPVAWMSSVNGETVYVGYEPADGWLAIPLYTHPADLTDEQVIDITKAFFNIHPDAELSEQFRIKLYELEDFARAILKKASEK